MMNSSIPLSIPNFEGNEKKYVDDAINEGWVSTGGQYITRFEKQMADYLAVHEVVACQSGTAGIHLALVEAGVGQNDLVIVPTLTFIAAVNPVKYQFADPVFMDCDDSLCMDSNKLKAFCEEECIFQDSGLIHKSTQRHVKAIIVVHVFGNLADMECIMEIATRYHLIVIEDATEALGTRYEDGIFEGKYAGTIGDYGVFSFNGNKIITTGGGGAITGKNEKAIRHIKYLSTQAKDDSQYYIHNEVGYNYRMTNVQAAIGVAQMEELDMFIKRKHESYNQYKLLFEHCRYICLMPFRRGTYSNQWFFSLKIDFEECGLEMKELVSRLQERGIQTRAIWGLIHNQRPYMESIVYNMENAPYYVEHIINIPCSTQITPEEISFVAKNIMELVEGKRIA